MLTKAKGKSSRPWLRKEASGHLTITDLGGDVLGLHNGRKRGTSELERLQLMPESLEGGKKRCARCHKRWSLDSGGWGKRGNSEGETEERKWNKILRARVSPELREEKEAEMEESAQSVLVLGRKNGLILGKRVTINKATGNPVSKVKTRDLEASTSRKRRALPPLDQYGSKQTERIEPATNLDLVFVVPLGSTGWDLDHWGWMGPRWRHRMGLGRREFFSERIDQINVSRKTKF